MRFDPTGTVHDVIAQLGAHDPEVMDVTDEDLEKETGELLPVVWKDVWMHARRHPAIARARVERLWRAMFDARVQRAVLLAERSPVWPLRLGTP